MNQVPFHAAPAPPWLPMLPPNPPQSSGFWQTKNVHYQLKELQETLILAKAMQKELEVLMTMKDTKGSVEHGEMGNIDPFASGFSKYLEDRKIDLKAQESLSVDAACSLMSKLRAQLEPFQSIIDGASHWEERSAAIRLSNKMLKAKRNKLWRKRKRKCIAEMRAKKQEQFDQADREADEWRAREIAKDAAQLKVEKMKEIAKLKVKEERKRLESELELVLIVEKLQELRSMRIQKLKKQGHFLPEEDDKFLERVRAAVEEEERQAIAAADKDAAKGAIATVEESRDGGADKRGAKGKGKHGKKKGSTESRSESKAIWVCLECGHYACGGVGLPTTPQSHAVRHARQTRHPLVIQWENPHLRWCFSCNTLIPVETIEENGEKKDALLDVVKLIKTQSSEKSSMDVEDVWFGGGSVSTEIKAEGVISSSLEVRGCYIVRGLVNLGNTCFFNSVMQNLLAMDKLRDFFFDQDASFGPLTIALKKLFAETKPEMGIRSVINPRSFFGCICSKAPQFRGYQQQDSHELLRCLLDGLSSEELAVRKQINASKEDGISLKHGPTFVDALFGGQISSTVSCIECGHSSSVYEPFLDLSLPVPMKKPPTKKAQTVSRPKKTKLPPKRGGRIRGKANKDTESVPAQCISNASASNEHPCQTQSTVPHAENVVASSGDAVGSESVCLTTVAGESGLASENFSTLPDTENEQIVEAKVEHTAASYDDFTWMDYLGPETISDEPGFTLQNNDVSTSQYSGNMIPNDALVENSQACSVDGEPNPKPDSSINPWEEEVPLQVTGSEVLLLPYKEESFTDGKIMKGEAEASSSVMGCRQDEADFDGFGDLFNEPEVSSGPVAGPSIDNETARTGFTAGNSSESDPDEVDNSDSPVSIESCLAHFIKPELLSNDNAWECENCSKIMQHQRLEAKKKQSKNVLESMVNGGEAQIQSHPPTLDKNILCSTEVGNLRNGDINAHAFVNSTGESLVLNNGKSQNCIKAESSQIDELKPIVSQSEEQKGDMTAAPAEQSHSSALYESCSQESLSSPAVDSCNIDKPSSTGYTTAKDQLGYRDSQFSGNFEVEEDEDEERTSRKVKVKRDATKRVLVDKAPPILTIHLKRFSQDARGRLSKLNGHVNFGDILDLRPYMDPRCTDIEKYVYRLLGVVEHLGTMRGGHYVAYVRGGRSKGKAENENGGSVWYNASDVYVREVSLEEVLRCEAYILFYEKI